MSNAHDSHGPARYARHYVPDRPAHPLDRVSLRQVLAGGAVVVGLELATALLSLVASLAWGHGPEGVIDVAYRLGKAVLFAAVVAVAGLYLLPLGRAVGTRMVLSRVLVGGGIATAFLIAERIAWLVLTPVAPLGIVIISDGFVQSMVVGLQKTALFALGVMVIRSVPERPRDESALAPVPPT